jgi:hypothetical protein
MTGSVVLPINALLMSTLTLCVTFATLVPVFQDARFEGIVDYVGLSEAPA